ncbi:hypothetical protein DFS34DRAFT_428575 [Phlyctochytrium arcticum]|nr:hypothetical protein DFS34DRAFT_428575 [Phlyctochytrium arcticum]
MKVSGSDHEGSGKVGIIRLPTDPDEIMLQMEEFQKLAPHTDLTAQHAQVDTENDCYFQIRSLLYTTPERQLKLLLTRGLYLLLDIRSLGIFLAVYLGLSLITYYIALPTDLVIPNLIMGAVCGRICAVAWNQMMPALMIDPGFIALIGMAGLWAATSRLTLTVIVICFELTGDFDAIPALIIVSFVAAWVSSFLGESLYHLEMHNNHTPYLPSEPSHHLRTICVRQIMSSRDLVVVTTTAKLSACVEAIESGHNGFPVCEKLVVEDSDRRQVIRYRPVGFVYRDLLHETTSSLLQTAAYDPAETRLDLTTLMNVSPTIVREDATAAKVFSVLRSLGLRHIIVVDRDGFLVGLVTRKDLVRAMHHPHDTKTKRKRFWRRRDNRDTDSHQDKDDDGNQALRNRKHTTSTGPRQEREGGSSTLASGSSHSVPRPEMTKIQDKEQQQMGTTSTSTLQTTHDLQSSSTRMGFETPPESSPLASTHNSSFNLPLVAPSDPTSTPSTGIQLSTSSHGRTFDPKDGTLSRDFHVLHPLPGNVQPIRPPLRFTPLSNSSLKDTIIQPTRFDSLQSDSDFDSDDEEDEQLADIGDPPAGPPLVPRLSTRGWRRHEGRVLDGET